MIFHILLFKVLTMDGEGKQWLFKGVLHTLSCKVHPEGGAMWPATKWLGHRLSSQWQSYHRLCAKTSSLVDMLVAGASIVGRLTTHCLDKLQIHYASNLLKSVQPPTFCLASTFSDCFAPRIRVLLKLKTHHENNAYGIYKWFELV